MTLISNKNPNPVTSADESAVRVTILGVDRSKMLAATRNTATIAFVCTLSISQNGRRLTQDTITFAATADIDFSS